MGEMQKACRHDSTHSSNDENNESSAITAHGSNDRDALIEGERHARNAYENHSMDYVVDLVRESLACSVSPNQFYDRSALQPSYHTT